MLTHSPSTSAVMQELKDFMHDYPVIGHNIAFDLRFLRAEFKRAGLNVPTSCSPAGQHICTRSLARITRDRLTPEPENLKLITLKVLVPK